VVAARAVDLADEVVGRDRVDLGGEMDGADDRTVAGAHRLRYDERCDEREREAKSPHGGCFHDCKDSIRGGSFALWAKRIVANLVEGSVAR
jgi:hypothetical protein